ncbi:HAD family phosphatase [Criibacterium bergeronii]|uniref:HAD family phosphatase n=1 Tax=Criibacterium bergeronii TaxID=1871336 RepID=A0A552V3K7_9FIRM|nr:Cof-type HAD-IIB family hydrolase [Criibacterium bergeronii]TRW25027.1 HAD family phosphatase [Criibacterium bergeronii]
MIKKLIVTDIDGTLLDSTSNIPQSAIKALAYAKENGAYFTLASGRTLNGVMPLVDTFKITCPLILANGAIVYDIKNQKTIFKKLIDKKTAKQLANIIKSENAFFYFYDEGSVYATDIRYAIAYYDKMNKLGKTNLPIHLVEDLEAASQKHDAIKFVIHEDDLSTIAYLRKIFEPIEQKLEISSSAPWNIEITAAKLSKGSGVIELAKYLGVDMQNVMCIGDELNDLSMLKVAGFAVAMGNANEELKKVAHFITDDNNNDGFAKAIYKFMEK